MTTPNAQKRVTTAHKNLNFVDFSQTVTIANGQTDSPALSLNGSNSICAIGIPPNFQGTYITFRADFGDGLKDLVYPDGTLIQAIVLPNQIVVFPLFDLLPVQNFQVVAPIPQTSDSIFRIITRYAL
jgi:hypothetical protein